LAQYRPSDSKEAADIVEKVVPRLQHVNAAVVLGAIKVIMVYFNYVIDEEVLNLLNKKLTPSLSTFFFTNLKKNLRTK
jgi:vesicle coat complex subunit